MLAVALRIATAVVSCLTIGLPLLGFPALRSFLFSQGVFEGLCRVHPSAADIHCLDRQLAFDRMFARGSISAGTAYLIAFYFLEYTSTEFTAIIGNFIVAAGALALSTSPSDWDLDPNQVDNYTAGFVLLCFGVPFVLLGALSSVGVAGSRRHILLLILIFLSQLSTWVWTFWVENFGPNSVSQLFTQYLIAPTILIALNLLSSGLSSQISSPAIEDTVHNLHEALQLTSSDKIHTWVADYESLIQDNNLQGHLLRADTLQDRLIWLMAILVFYIPNMLVMNIYLSAGPEYARYSDHAPEYTEKLLASSVAIISAVAILVGYLLLVKLSRFYVTMLTGAVCCLCPLLLLVDMWEAVTCLVPVGRAFLDILLAEYCLVVFGDRNFGPTYALALFCGGISGAVIPRMDEIILAYADRSQTLLVSVAIAQALGTIITLHMLQRLYVRVDRSLLETEAEAVPAQSLPF